MTVLPATKQTLELTRKLPANSVRIVMVNGMACDAQFQWLLGGQRVAAPRLRGVAQPHHRLP
ncbi:MAG: hypothetical protein ACRDRU_14670 [Pseudonocardiaceae bacterium]